MWQINLLKRSLWTAVNSLTTNAVWPTHRQLHYLFHSMRSFKNMLKHKKKKHPNDGWISLTACDTGYCLHLLQENALAELLKLVLLKTVLHRRRVQGSNISQWKPRLPPRTLSGSPWHQRQLHNPYSASYFRWLYPLRAEVSRSAWLSCSLMACIKVTSHQLTESRKVWNSRLKLRDWRRHSSQSPAVENSHMKEASVSLDNWLDSGFLHKTSYICSLGVSAAKAIMFGWYVGATVPCN